METRDAIIGRRSVREYESKQVPKDVINQILKAGAMAPSAMDAKPCRFIVIANQEKIKELSSKVKDKLGVIGLGLKMSEVMKSNKDTIFYGAPLLHPYRGGKDCMVFDRLRAGCTEHDGPGL